MRHLGYAFVSAGKYSSSVKICEHAANNLSLAIGHIVFAL